MINRYNTDDMLPSMGWSVCITRGGTITVTPYPVQAAAFICSTEAEADLIATTLSTQRSELDALRAIHTRYLSYLCKK